MNKHFLSSLFFSLALLISVPSFATDDMSVIDKALGPITNSYITAPYKGLKDNYNALSLLSEHDQKHPANLWKGSKSSDIIKELDAFTSASGSSALREIWRTTLLDDFKGVSFGGKKKQKQVDLMVARMKTLNKLGLFHDTIRLYRAIEQKPIPSDIAEQAIDAFALAGMADTACLEVTFVTQSVRTIDWLKKRSICAARDGNKKLSKTLNKHIHAKQKEPDAIHDSVSRLLKKGKIDGPVKLSLSPLQRTLLLSHGGTISNIALGKADGMALTSFSMSPYISAKKRLKAALKAADLGTISSKQLETAIEAITYTPEQIAGAKAKLLNGNKTSISLAYQALVKNHDPKQRAIMLNTLINQQADKTSTITQLWLRFIDKIASQADDSKLFADKGYAIAVWQDYISAAKGFRPHVSKPLLMLEKIAESQILSNEDVTSLTSYIKNTHKNSYKARISGVLSALKGAGLIQDDALDPEILKTWRDNNDLDNILFSKKLPKGITLLKVFNALNTLKTSKLSKKITYQIIDIIRKNNFFEENRKLALEITIQSVL